MGIKQKENKGMELVEKCENITFDEENSSEKSIFIDFCVNGMNYYLKLVKYEGKWVPMEICHFWEDEKQCELCEENVVNYGLCIPKQPLYDFSKDLLNKPSIRVKALLNGWVF